MTDRVWSSIKPRITRPWGSALNPATDGRIVSPPLITEPTRLPRKGVAPIPVAHLKAIFGDDE